MCSSMGHRRKCHTSAAATPLAQDGFLHLQRLVQQQQQEPQLMQNWIPKQCKWILSTGTRKKSCFQCALKPVNEGRTRDRSLKIICKKRGAFCVGRPERRSTASASLSQAPNNAASSSLVCPRISASKEARSHITCAGQLGGNSGKLHAPSKRFNRD